MGSSLSPRKPAFGRSCGTSCWDAIGPQMNEPIGLHVKIIPDLFDSPMKFFLGDNHSGLTILQDEPDLGGDEPKIDRDRNQACLGHRRIDLEPLDPIPGEHRDTVTFCEAEAEPGVGKPAGARVAGGKRQGAVQVARPDPIRSDCNRAWVRSICPIEGMGVTALDLLSYAG